MTPARPKFDVALTADFFDGSGRPKFEDMGLSVFAAHPHVRHSPFREHRVEIGPDQVAGSQGVIVLTPRVTAQTVSAADDLLAVARFGVGYDGVDVPACTRAGVAVFITTGAVDRSVAEATVGWMLALTHHTLAKDRLVRTGNWDERTQFMGCELRGRTFGAVGLGGIARETLRLLSVFGMNPPIAHDPLVDPAAAAAIGVRLVDLDALMVEADFVSIHCPLNEQTRNLIGARELSVMKPTSYLINTARGGIVDEDDLYEALRVRRIAGAAIDCFVGEPLRGPHHFGELDNALLAPHSIAWTGEMFRDIGRMACQGMVDLSLGRRPRGVVNPEVFDSPAFQRKWQRFTQRPQGANHAPTHAVPAGRDAHRPTPGR